MIFEGSRSLGRVFEGRDSTIIYSNIYENNCCSFFLQTTPTSEEIGHCDEIRVSEIGGTSVTIFKQGTVWVTYCSAIDVTKSLFFLWLLLFNPVSNWSIHQMKA